jgi:hypothetical protein
MPVIDVLIVRRDREDAPWVDVLDRPTFLVPGDCWRIAGIEGGMESGAPSVMLRVDLEDGQVVIGQNSLAAWIGATCALRGAFPEAFVGTPLEGRPDGP